MNAIDFNRSNRSEFPISVSINKRIADAEPQSQPRPYLGASSIGDGCLRKIQYTWKCDPVFTSQQNDRFARGHFFEDRTRNHLIAAGLKFAPPGPRLGFQALDGQFRGHCDGIIDGGPELPGLLYPSLWEAKCLRAKGWKDVDRDGLTGLNAKYASQVAVYQFYLNVTNPALFTVVNADNCEELHFLVPFNAQLAQEMIERAKVVIEATRKGELLPRAYDSPDDWRCEMCPFKERCWSQPAVMSGTPSPQTEHVS